MKKSLKILMLFDCLQAHPRGYDFSAEFAEPDGLVYGQVRQALINNGHQVSLLGVCDDLQIIFDEVKENRPDLVFNLTDIFDDKSHLDKNVAWFLEMLGLAHTGASPANLLVCNNKALSKKILSYHRIKVPNFHVFFRGHKVWKPSKLKFPVIVKPLKEEASRGISQASFTDDEAGMVERIKFIHDSMSMDAIAEEYIEGREFYVSVMGAKRTTVLPLREMKFGQMPEGGERIATYRAKWDAAYRDKWGIKNVFAGRLPEGWEKKITEVCKRAFRALELKGYVRFDVRVTEVGQVYIIEPNANPNLSRDDEFALSAEKSGIEYDALIQRIVDMGCQEIKN